MPKIILTKSQRLAIPARIAAGDKPADIARELGVTREAVLYHARNQRHRRAIACPWRGRISAAQRFIRGGDYPRAHAALLAAAEAVAKRLPPTEGITERTPTVGI